MINPFFSSGIGKQVPVSSASRIVLLSSHYPPDPSGIGDYTHFLANGLAQLGYEVAIITSVGSTDRASYPVAAGVRVHRVVAGWGVRQLPRIIRLLKSLPESALIIQYAPHAFSRRGIGLGPSLLAGLARLRTKHRVIVNFHEISIPFSMSWKRLLGALWQRATGLVIAASAHALTAASEEWVRRLRRIGVWKPVRVIPVGSNIPLAPVEAAERRAVREGLGVGDQLLLGCFGSLDPGRDEALLLRALAHIQRRRPARLVWLGNVGKPPVRSGEANIVWTGRLPHQALSRLMSCCEIFVLPFRKGVSTRRTTVAAALLHGLPILTTRGPATADIFVDGENMLLAAAGDSEGFLAALEQLAEDPQLRLHLRQRAKGLYESHFSWEVIARRVAEVVMTLGAPV